MTADDVNPYILTAEERAAWKDRISKMRNEGLFTPPGLEETISLPGARGGSNWGTTCRESRQGHGVSHDAGLADHLQARPRRSARRAPRGIEHGRPDQGRTIYERRCQSCHGPDGVGSAGGPPAVAGKQSSRARCLPPGRCRRKRRDARIRRSRCRGNRRGSCVSLPRLRARLARSSDRVDRQAWSWRLEARLAGWTFRKSSLGRVRSAALRIQPELTHRRTATTPTGVSIPTSRTSSVRHGRPSSRTT